MSQIQRVIEELPDGVFSGMMRATLAALGKITFTIAELEEVAKRPKEIIAIDLSVPGKVSLSLQTLPQPPRTPSWEVN